LAIINGPAKCNGCELFRSVFRWAKAQRGGRFVTV
jgi:hypothetical protein